MKKKKKKKNLKRGPELQKKKKNYTKSHMLLVRK